MKAHVEASAASVETRGQRGFGSLAWSALTTIGLLVVVALAALMLAPPLFGLERYVITGGSMSGSIERGSIVFEEVVPVAELEVGDVITYEPPVESGADGLVTHRIVAIRRADAGAPVIRTKGDANAAVDPWRFRLDAGRQPRVVSEIPKLGYLLSALGIREVRMALIGIPALLVALGLFAGLWRDTGADVRDAALPEKATGR